RPPRLGGALDERELVRALHLEPVRLVPGHAYGAEERAGVERIDEWLGPLREHDVAPLALAAARQRGAPGQADLRVHAEAGVGEPRPERTVQGEFAERIDAVGRLLLVG